MTVPRDEANLVAELVELATMAGARMGSAEVLRAVSIVKRAVYLGEHGEPMPPDTRVPGVTFAQAIATAVDQLQRGAPVVLLEVET